MDKPGELDVWNVSGSAGDSLEVPNGFCSEGPHVSTTMYGFTPPASHRHFDAITFEYYGNLRAGVYLIQESTSVSPVKDASESPRLVLERLDIHNFH